MPDAEDEIRAGIDAAHAAAERLVREAEARARAQAGDVPPRGWDVPEDSRPSPAFPELTHLVGLLEQVRGAIPAELTVQLAEALRDLLIALRALLDWYIERIERVRPGAPNGATGGPRVEDIPID